MKIPTGNSKSIFVHRNSVFLLSITRIKKGLFHFSGRKKETAFLFLSNQKYNFYNSTPASPSSGTLLIIMSIVLPAQKWNVYKTLCNCKEYPGFCLALDSGLFWPNGAEEKYLQASEVLQEKPTNCETKAADVLDKLFSQQTLKRIHWIFWCIWNYFDFTTPTNSKCCSNCYRSAVI